MRPVNKTIPTNNAGHFQIIFNPYGDAKEHLLKQLGNYCSYCEYKLPSFALEVEHLLDKNSQPQFEFDWNNFLLACKVCNTIKGTKDLTTKPHCLPHIDNPLCYIELDRFLWCAKLKTGLTSADEEKAKNYIALTGLDRQNARLNVNRRDDRVQGRNEVATLALLEKKRYDPNNPNDLRNLLNQATKNGFFSVWLTVFAQYSEVKNALIRAFEGTAAQCFDINGDPIPR